LPIEFARVIIKPMIEFPGNFLWGAASSAYQVEGDNSNSDWWHWERSQAGIAASGAACRHYRFFREDFDLAKSLGHNSHRLSVEWSRIQPEPGKFREEEISHYIQVVDHLRRLNIEPVVTLHHFTNPVWFSRIGGWENPRAPEIFLDYARKLVSALGDKVKYWVTINEPMVYAYYSYMTGDWPPQVKSPFRAAKVIDNLTRAHIRCYRLIHSIYRENKLIQPMVSIAHNMIAFEACRKSLRNKLAVHLKNRLFNFRLLDKLSREKTLDFIGLNYYTRHLIDTQSWSLNELLSNTCSKGHDLLAKNSLGWEIYPEGLYTLLAALKKYRLPVFILENGICTEDDSLRWSFIREHLKQLRKASLEGVDVIGYLYWSLMDNFEWDKGFSHRFGLCAVDYSNFKRSPRGSAGKFAQVARTGVLEE
jgi:beta-glucosidase